MASRASHTAEVVLENCRAPEDLLGGMETQRKLEHRAVRARMAAPPTRPSSAPFRDEPPSSSPSALGIAQAVPTSAPEYLNIKTVDGGKARPVGSSDSQVLAYVATEISFRAYFLLFQNSPPYCSLHFQSLCDAVIFSLRDLGSDFLISSSLVRASTLLVWATTT